MNIEEKLIKSGIFDERYYAEKYKDVGYSKLIPVEHYLNIGLKLSRKPSNEYTSKDVEMFLEGKIDSTQWGDTKNKVVKKDIKEQTCGEDYNIEPWHQFNIDEIEIIDGKIKLYNVNQKISGWIVSKENIKAITLIIGDEKHKVYQGIKRKDVFEIFPENYNGIECGFTIFLNSISININKIQFYISTKKGNIIKEYNVVIEKIHTTQKKFNRLVYSEKKLLLSKKTEESSIYFLIILNDISEYNIERKILNTLEDVKENIRNANDACNIIVATNNNEIRVKCRELGIQAIYESNRANLIAKINKEKSWVILCVPGDRYSEDLILNIISRDYEKYELLYWDEFDNCGKESELLKPPGSPFYTLLSQNYIQRGFCSRITKDIENDLVKLELAKLSYVIPLKIFSKHDSSLHIAKILSSSINSETINTDKAEDEAREVAIQNITKYRNYESIYFNHESKCIELNTIKNNIPKVSIIIPTIAKNNKVFDCLLSIREVTLYKNYELLILDHLKDTKENNHTKCRIREFSDIHINVEGDFNWSKFNNIGAAKSNGEILLFLNDDVVITDPSWLCKLVPYCMLENVGSVGPQLLTPDGLVQSSGVSIFNGRGLARSDYEFCVPDGSINNGLNRMTRNVSSLLGAAIMTRRELFINSTGFNEKLPLTFNDLDYNMRLNKMGYNVLVNPNVSLIHYEKNSRIDIEEKEVEEEYFKDYEIDHILEDRFIHPRLDNNTGLFRKKDETSKILWNTNQLDEAENIKKILILRLDHIGDFALSLSAFKKLRDHFRLSEFTIVCGQWNYELAKESNIFDKVLIYNYYQEISGEGIEEMKNQRLSFSNLLQNEKYDLAVDFRNDLDTRKFLEFTLSRFKAAFGHNNSYNYLDISSEYLENIKNFSRKTNISKSLELLSESIINRFPLFVKSLAEPSLANKIIIHPFSGNPIKDWPIDNWCQLIKLLKNDKRIVYILGSKADLLLKKEDLKKLVAAGAICICGKYSLVELLDFIKDSLCFIGVDSGPKHLASQTGISGICLQSGFVDPHMWSAASDKFISIIHETRCHICYIDNKNDCVRNVECMSKISPATVFKSFKQLT